MPRTVERTVYKFSELSESAKGRARDKYRQNHGNDYEWWECTYEDAVICAACLGIEVDTKDHNKPAIYFRGFCSQGDGASFEGRYRYKPDTCAATTGHAPQDEELKAIAEELTLLQLTRRLEGHEHFGAIIKSKRDTWIEVEVFADNDDEPVTAAFADDVTTLLRRFADWIYAQLEAEDEYLNSDEHVDECLADDEFDEDGDVV